MANEFFRKPIIGGDNNSWAAYNDAYIKNAIGDYTSYLFDDSGTLKVSAGRIGINDGTNLGVSIIEETAITLSGTAGIWQKIEMTVSGTSVTFTATDIAGATDPVVIPATFTAAYSASKGGYYMVAAARTIGVVWVNAAGALAGVVNVKNGVFGYNGKTTPSAISEFFVDAKRDSTKKRVIIEIGTWNMNAITGKSVSFVTAAISSNFNWFIANITITVRADPTAGTFYYPNSRFVNAADPNLIDWGIVSLQPGVAASLAVRTGGVFQTNADYNDSTINRGYVVGEYEE